MKKKEIERKFLLKRLPLLISVADKEDLDQLWIRQYYTPEGRYRAEYRITGRTFTHCVKTDPLEGGSKLAAVKDEEETIITYNEFRSAISKADRYLTKKRFAFHVGEVKWDIDVYDNMQLVTAEAEIPTPDFPLEIPDFIKDELIMEVTGVKAFNNWALAEPGKMSVTVDLIDETLEELKKAAKGLS